jgi:aryl-alcohol dehydrogenase-like predicted oxidoreductase
MRALDDLVRQGKVRYIGCSNMPAWQVVDAQWIASSAGLTSFVSCQDEYSLLLRGAETDLFPVLRAKGLGLLPYYPLAGGLLTGKYTRGADAPDGTRFKDARFSDRYMTDANWSKVEKLQTIADEAGMSLLELSFAWLLSRPEVSSVIAGATRPEQIAANVQAGARKLSPEVVASIDAAT